MIVSKNKRIARGFAVLTGGVAITQLIVILSSPILTRLYTPENFGMLAAYMSFLGVLSVGSSLRYELALPTSENIKEEVNLFSLSIAILVFNFLILSTVTYFFSEYLFLKFNLEELIAYRWFIPFGLLFIGAYKVSIQLATKQKRYKDVAQTKVTQSLSMVFIQILLFKFGAVSLILGHIIGQSLGLLKVISKDNILEKIKKHVNKKGILEIAIKYQNFPKFSLFSSLMNTLGSQLPVILLTALFSPAIAGFYALAQRIIFLPVTMLTQSIVGIIFGEGKELKSNNQLEDRIWSLHKTLTMLSLPLMIPTALALPVIFEKIFGTEWIMSGEFAALLLPWFFLVFTMTPVFDTFEAFYNQKLLMFFQFFLSVSRVIGIYIGYIQDSAYKSLLYFTFSSIVIFLVFFLIIIKSLKISFSEVVKFYLNVAIVVLLVSCPFMLRGFIDEKLINWLTFIPGILITMYYVSKNLSYLKKSLI